MSVIFVDVETTGLEPDRHEIWEIALIEEDGTEHEWRLEPQHMRQASPDALRITGFYDRVAAAGEDGFFSGTSRPRIAWEVARLTAGRHLVGAVPSFDARFLADFLRSEGHVEAWHYHLVDVEALAAGRLGIAPPWDPGALAEQVGVTGLGGKHTALGDARWAKAIYEAVFAGRHVAEPTR